MPRHRHFHPGLIKPEPRPERLSPLTSGAAAGSAALKRRACLGGGTAYTPQRSAAAFTKTEAPKRDTQNDTFYYAVCTQTWRVKYCDLKYWTRRNTENFSLRTSGTRGPHASGMHARSPHAVFSCQPLVRVTRHAQLVVANKE